jgi:DNA-binding NarL/FixJ family response regulator
MSSPATSILLVDDHFVTRHGLRSLLEREPDLQVIGEAGTGAEAVPLFRQHRPTVVVLDMRLPDLDGASVTAQLRREDAGARILVLSSHGAEADVARAMSAGALGYVTKETDGAEIVAAVRAVARGQRHLPPHLAARLEAHQQESPLGARDLQLLHLIRLGLTNREIAGRLRLTPGTVGVYVTQMLERLGASNRTEAVTLALARGILHPDDPRSG